MSYARNLFKLFVYFSKINEYDKDQLIKYFKNESFVNNLAVTKKKLYERILMIMRGYHSKKNDYRIILGNLSDIEFLYEKGFFEECENLIEKSLKICIRNEFYSLGLQFQDWQRNIISVTYHEKKNIPKISDSISKTNDLITKYNHFQEAHHFLIELGSSYFHRPWKDNPSAFKAYISDRKKVLQELLLRTKDSQSDIEAYFLNSALGATQLYDKNLSAIEELLESSHINYENTNYLSLSTFISNQIVKIKIKLLLNSVENIEQDIEVLEKACQKHPYLISNDIDEIITMYKLQFLYLFGKEGHPKFMDKIQSIVNNDNFESLPICAWFCFHLSRYYFTIGQYNDALSWNLKSLNLSFDFAKNFNYIIRFHSAMIYLELEQYDKLQICIRDLYRYLKRKGGLLNNEKTLLSFFKVIQKNWGKKYNRNLFTEFELITNKYKEEIEKNFKYVELDIWIKAKQANSTVLQYKIDLRKTR